MKNLESGGFIHLLNIHNCRSSLVDRNFIVSEFRNHFQINIFEYVVYKLPKYKQKKSIKPMAAMKMLVSNYIMSNSADATKPQPIGVDQAA